MAIPMISHNKYWVIVLVFIFSACKTRTSETVTSPASAVPGDSLLVSLQRGACFGACPQFTCTIYKTGLAVYDGERNVKKTGIWKAQVSTETLSALVGLIRNYKVEEKDTVYINKYLADYPAFFITVSDQKPARRIYVNHDQPPVEITEFVSELEKTMDALEWKNLQGLKVDE
ncbi:MAG: DUF6438 domain-containing protein [Bacteroidia bacterium]